MFISRTAFSNVMLVGPEKTQMHVKCEIIYSFTWFELWENLDE